MDPNPARLIHDPQGLNTAPSPASLAGTNSTATEFLFTRSHAPAPIIDPDTWRLRVHGEVGRELALSLAQLRSAFAFREVSATLICAGLRRRELLTLGPLGGELPWGPEAAGTATWRGVALADVLAHAAVNDRARHVGFTGLDRVERSGRMFGFGGSISIEKAMDPAVLLAFELNGGPVPREHGFPVRVVVPGWIGARSVKWLGEIELRTEPSNNYFQTSAYRFDPTPNALHDVRGGIALEEVRLNAVILSPETGSRVAAGVTVVQGWAIGWGGRPILRVEVSSDGGLTWKEAEIAPQRDRWTWRRWRASVTLDHGSHDIVARAWDDTGAPQPERLAEVWNVKGYANNAWHRITVEAAER